MMYPDRVCRKCTDADKETWGCTVPVRQPYQMKGDEPMGLCPLVEFRDHPELEDAAFGLHMHWAKGIMPQPGGLDDQPAGYMAIITAAELGINTAIEVKQEIAKAKASKPKGPPTGARGTSKP